MLYRWVYIPSDTACQFNAEGIYTFCIDAGGIRNVIKCFEKAKDRISVNEIATLLAKIDYVYPYHQALGFVLQKVGVPENSLSPLKAGKIRFKFYLDYAMKNPAFDPDWKVYYPADIPREI